MLKCWYTAQCLKWLKKCWKKLLKNLHNQIICRYFAPDLRLQSVIRVVNQGFWKIFQNFRKKIWKLQKLALPLQPLSRFFERESIRLGSWKNWKIFEKDLEVSKIVLTFAPLSDFKNRRQKTSKIEDSGPKINIRSLRNLSS